MAFGIYRLNVHCHDMNKNLVPLMIAATCTRNH